eukprot:gene15352-16928_t
MKKKSRQWRSMCKASFCSEKGNRQEDMSVLHPRGKRYLRADIFNRNFICKLCKGYLIRPVAITECLHTFCRSCLVKYLENAVDYDCPNCQQQIHETNPWEHLKEDKTLEEIIFKLVPGLWKSERQRREEFYSSEGLPVPDELDLELTHRPSTPISELVKKPQVAPEETGNQRENNTNNNNSTHVGENKQQHNQDQNRFPEDTQIGFHLSYLETGEMKVNFRQLEKRFIRCSSYLTVGHLKKYLKYKLKLPDSCEVDILCNGEIMGKHHTLEFIYMTRWRFMNTLLRLDYRPKVELTEL